MTKRFTGITELCLILSLAVPAAPLAAVQLDTTEVELATLSEETIVQSCVLSRDCQHVAFVNQDESGTWVVVDGVASKKYPHVLAGEPLRFSPDGTRLAYVATAPQRDRSFVVVDGREWPAVERLGQTNRLHFSPDSKRLAFVCGRGEQDYVMVDGVFGKGYMGVALLKFSPGGERYAFVAVPRAGKQVLVVEGIAGAEYDEVAGTAFSADGKHVACVCKRGDKRFAVLDGKEQKEYPYIGYLGSRRPEQTTIPDAQKTALFFSPDGERLVYFAGAPGKWRLVEGSSESDVWDEIGSPAFSPDSRHLAFRAGRGGRPFIVVDGVARALDGQTASIGTRYSPNGARLAHILVRKQGRMCVIVDDAAGAEWDHIASERDGSNLWFSPDSQHLAYIAERNLKYYLVRDGDQGNPHYGLAAVSFSPDSKHLACLATGASARKVVIDGAPAPMKPMDRVVASLHWKNSNTLYTAIQRGRSVLRLEVTAR